MLLYYLMKNKIENLGICYINKNDFEEYLKQIGAETSLRAIRYTVYRAIGQTYPELSRECLTQYEYSQNASRERS